MEVGILMCELLKVIEICSLFSSPRTLRPYSIMKKLIIRIRAFMGINKDLRRCFLFPGLHMPHRSLSL